MAVTYNHWINATYIYREMKDAGGNSTWGPNDGKGATYRDFFVDAPRVNDAIYFTTYTFNPFRGCGQWENLRINVGTARTNAGAGVWEYWNGSAWTALSVTDPTNGFTVVGTHTITFTPPEDWRDCQVNGSYWSYYIRYRLTNVTGITQGGATGSTAPQMQDRALHVTGYSSTTPCDFNELYNQSVANGWGVVERNGASNSRCPGFILRCNLVVGDGSTATYFIARNQMAQLGGNLYVRSYATFQLGDPSPDGLSSRNGCVIVMTDPDNERFYGFRMNQANSTCKLYNTTFSNYTEAEFGNLTGTFIIKDCIGPFCTFSGSFDIDGLQLCFGGYWSWGFRFAGTIGNVSIKNVKTVQSGGYGVSFTWVTNNKSYEIKNTEFHDNNKDYVLQASGSCEGWSISFTDCVNFNINSYATSGTISTCLVNECYTIDLTVVDPENKPIPFAKVKLIDAYGTTAYSSTVGFDGKTSFAAKVKSLYFNNGGVYAGDYNPNTLVVSQDGFETVAIPITLTEKKVMQVCLKHSPFIGPSGMGVEWQ